jgi:hypothetical protein
LKRGLPTIDAHPMNIQRVFEGISTLKINLAIARPYESWNVVSLINLNEKQTQDNIDFCRDLYLEEGTYHIYDFWAKRYLGEFEKMVELPLLPFETKVLGIRKKVNHPQIISTLRHLTQGAVDIADMYWDEHTGKYHSLIT